jgi:hypothetical protein
MARCLRHIFIVSLLLSLLAGSFAQAATWNTYWGNVGVGKTPATVLDIIGGVNTTGTINGTGVCIAGVCKTDWTQVSASSTNFWGGTKNSNIWNGDSGAGNVGIGTTAPTSYLHVVSTSTIPAAVFMNGNVGIGTTAPDQRLEINGGGIGFDGNSADKKLYSSADGDLEWVTNNAAGAHGFAVSNQGTKLVYLNTAGNSYFNGGNLGIRITNPGFPLETVGIISSKNTANSNNRHFVMNGYAGATWDLYGGHGGSSYFGISENQAVPYFAIQGGVGNVGIMKTNPAATVDIVGGLNASGTVNGTGLCISGDCKASWAAIGAAGSGWTRTAPYLYATTLTDNVGIGVTNPLAKLQVNGTGLITASGAARFDLYNTTYAGKFSNYVSDSGTWQLADNANNVKLSVATGTNGQIDFYPGSGNTIFNGTGNVGFGATPTEKLDVSGRIRITGNQTLAAGSTGPIFANVSGFGLQVSSGNVGIATNAATTPNFVINSSGNVGIGVTNPISKIYTQVAADDRIVINQTAANNYGYQWSYGGTREWDLFANNASGILQFYSNTAGAVMTLQKSNGNVGIMKTNPATTLDIVGGVSTTGTVNGTGLCISGDCKASWAAVGSASAGWNINGATVYKSDILGNVGIGTTLPTAKLAVSGGTVGADNAQGYTIKDSTGTYRWAMQGTSGNLLNIGDTAGWTSGIALLPGAAEAMRINASGNVGIGTTAPTSYLHVVSTSTVPAAVFMNGNVGIGTTAPAQKLEVAGAGRFSNESGGTLLELGQSSTTNQKQLLVQNNPTNNYFSFQGLQQNVTNYQNIALEPSGGNVGIAKTNPGTILDIVGGVSSTGTVNGTGLCIAGDCKASWPAVGAASSGWTISGINVYKTDTTGNVGIGGTNPGTYKLKVFGDMAVTGTLSTQTGSDFAEEFRVDEPLEPGTVVAMCDLGHKSVRPSETAYDKTVIGVVSDNPSIIAGRIDLDKEDQNKVIVAMAGVVSVKVNNDNGSIRRGDLLTSSSVKGYAMKADSGRSGTMIGKALENLEGRSGKIKVLIYLQ